MISNLSVIIFNYKQVCHPVRAQSTRLDTKYATRPIRDSEMQRAIQGASKSSATLLIFEHVQINVRDAVSRIIIDKSRIYLSKIERVLTIVGDSGGTVYIGRAVTAFDKISQRHGVCTS